MSILWVNTILIKKKPHKSRNVFLHILLISTFFLLQGASQSVDFQLRPNAGASPQIDEWYDIALRYAPFIYHATDLSGGRQDIVSNIDFDGDLRGDNNWENFDHFHLKPTVYYAVLETETHYFISYHLFHPRDWNHFTFYLHDTHENDGENLQIVVSKQNQRVVLLWTQAHYRSNVYTLPHTGISSGKKKISGSYQTVDVNGIPSELGNHAAVFVEAQGHGIYGTLDRSSKVILRRDGSYEFKKGNGIRFTPALQGEPIREPPFPYQGEAFYQLESITTKLWGLLRDGKLTGNGLLLDGSVPYTDESFGVFEVPRYYDANRFSGPFGPDRGISPFALDFSFKKGTLGALFFNPAQRYKEMLTISCEWSLAYLNYPFLR